MTEDEPTPDLPARASPYPVSRLAPPFGLVDLAKQIEQADAQLTARAGAQLEIIVEQIRHLQRQARAVLERTAADKGLHRAECRFVRVPGNVYHLYQRADGRQYFSMLSPRDWEPSEPPDPFVASFRLEPDMTWTPADRIDETDDDTRATVRALLEGGPPPDVG